MADKLLKFLAGSKKLRNFMPSWSRKLARKMVSINKYNLHLWKSDNPFVGTDKEWSYDGESRIKVGIIYDPAHYHKFYMSACIDMKISYRVIDIRHSNWIEMVKNCECDVIVTWASVSTTVLKEMTDERLRFIKDDLGFRVYPSVFEVWLYENKRRVRDWLILNDIDCPETWCFYIEDEALSFVEEAQYPIVFKTVLGSASHGVKICRTKEEARDLVKKCFLHNIPDAGSAVVVEKIVFVIAVFNAGIFLQQVEQPLAGFG